MHDCSIAAAALNKCYLNATSMTTTSHVSWMPRDLAGVACQTNLQSLQAPWFDGIAWLIGV